LGVTWYFGQRVQRSISRVVDSAASVAAGDYSSRIPSPGLGGEFDELADAFNSLAERLEAVESTRRRMLADLAHEMRTPLATLDAHLEALEDGVREPDANTFSVLRSSTERLGRLAQDMSAVSRAEEGGLDIHLEQSSPRPLVRAAVDAARERYVDKGVHLREEVTTDAPVLADPTRMGQVLGNLLDNALRHTPADGTVTVSCHLRGAWVELEVADTGEGIEAEHLGHVFDRFYRADPSRNRSQGGSGIGLTITKVLVEAQGGSISAHSDGPGFGATFTVRFPAR
jgi:two-component system, OmpR family, sensor histidine kinase BaeS